MSIWSARFMIISSLLLAGRALGRQRTEQDLLDAPVCDLRDEELIRIAAVDLVDGAEFLQRFARFAELADDGDRKSTRLNSSHSQISYAVFCLKKKKKKKNHINA